MVIKVCGMRDAENIHEVEKLDIDLMGMIFYPQSIRYVNSPPNYLPQRAKRVGIFVNESLEKVLSIKEQYSLSFIQLHGTESAEYCLSLHRKGIATIKAFAISTPSDLEATKKYEGMCSYFLFDTKCEEHGGSGKQFDWSVLSNYQGNTPFLLSGGISPECAGKLKAFQHKSFAGIDINSKFEKSPGIKDLKQLSIFINELRNIN